MSLQVRRHTRKQHFGCKHKTVPHRIALLFSNAGATTATYIRCGFYNMPFAS
jgi:hypothetical protein